MADFKTAAILLGCLFVCGLSALDADQLRKKAEKGDLEAMFALGDEFFYGSESTARNNSLAAYWYHRAAAGGLPEAMFNYGVCLDRGLGVKQNREEAFGWYRKASDAGSLHAKFNLLQILLTGIPPDEEKKIKGIPASPGLARLYLKELSDQHFEPAEIFLAELLLEQRNDPESASQAAEILMRLSEKENPDPKVLRMLADCRYAGLGMKRDMKEMIRLLKKAVDLGDGEAAGKLAFCYEYGRAVPPDEKQAFSLYRLGAERGNPMSQFKYAEFLISGRPEGSEPDVKLALRWYGAAASAGNPQAVFRLGVFHLEGMGPIERNPRRAAELFYQSARLGYAQAQYNLACMFSRGEGGLVKDDAAALFWFLQAAKQGDAPSARNIGLRYLEGRGVSRSITKAETWLRQAAEGGDSEAERILRTRFR